MQLVTDVADQDKRYIPDISGVSNGSICICSLDLISQHSQHVDYNFVANCYKIKSVPEAWTHGACFAMPWDMGVVNG